MHRKEGEAMKICIVGAGAIGGYLGVKLALSGADVTLIARGAHLEAIRQHGLKLIMADGSEQVATNTQASSDMRTVGVQDVIIVAVKAYSLPALAPDLQALSGPETLVVPAQNGIPWWYFHKHGGDYEGRRIEAVDPGGVIEQHMDVDRVIGCVVYPAASLVAPGVIRHIEGNRFILGELDGAKTGRVQQLARTLMAAGFKAPVRSHIRTDIWIKLWGNVAFNPISALTRATLGEIARYPLTRTLVMQMMAEAQAVGEQLGISFSLGIEQRIKGTEEIGAHKTSTLQDIEAGRTTEIDALVGAVAELGRLVGVPTPHIDAVYASVKLLEQQATNRG
jgi:2-dehydropantoate 2-reductase